MSESGYLFRGPRNTPESRAGRPPEPRTETRPGMVIDRDVAVLTGSGATIWVDVYRPADGEPAAPIIGWSPYGKHNPAPIGQIYPGSGVRPEWTSPLTTFEAPDPEYWVPHGYAIVIADIPGTWYSEGRATYLSPEEARAYADLIEWAGTQPWSNGRVGLSGVSYLTQSQWRVAELNPPHLAAINPWEGWTDTYREVVRHGGIPETSFWPYIWERWGASTGMIEDLEAEPAQHPSFDEFWASKAARLEEIRVPAFVVAELVGPGPALARHAGGLPPDLLGAQVARRARPQEVGLLLRPGERRAAARVLRPVPARRPGRPGLAAGPDGGTRVVLPGHPPRGQTGRRRPIPLLVPGRAGGSVHPHPPDAAAVAEYDSLGSAPGPADARVRDHLRQPAEIVGHSRLILHSRPPRRTISTCSPRCSRPAVTARLSGSRTTPSSRTARSRSAGCEPRTVSLTRSSAPNSWRCWPTGARCRSRAGGRPADIEVLPSGTRFEAGEGLLLIVQGTDINRYPKPLLCPARGHGQRRPAPHPHRSRPPVANRPPDRSGKRRPRLIAARSSLLT